MNVSYCHIFFHFSKISPKQLTKIEIFCSYFMLKLDSDLRSHLFFLVVIEPRPLYDCKYR